MRKYLAFAGISLLLFSFGCKRQQYVVTSMSGERITLDSLYEPTTASPMQTVVAKYKGVLDREMSVVIGVAAMDMTLGRPESLLTNLTSDAMKQAGDRYTNGKCDIAFMNVYGHRANLNKGNITIGSMFEVYSFENALVLVKAKGDVLQEIFESYAKMNGAGVSSNAHIEITKDGKLLSATIDGKPVDKNKTYTMVTLDYLAGGNDGMEALKRAESAEPMNITLRDEMIDYVKRQTLQGKEITSKLDGRITIKN